MTLADVQRMIDKIRFQLHSDQQVLSAEMEDLAARYADLCENCNERLRECESALKQGLAAEALHQAEFEPNLLDLVALLDFAERPEWTELLVLYGLKEPQPLLIDVAQTLNEAYSSTVSLESLLAQHRLLALARAPLDERARVLRLLAKNDPERSFWEDDACEMERALYREVEKAVPGAAAAKDVARLRELLRTITEPGMLVSAPPELIKLVKAKLQAVIRIHARVTLEQLEPQLNVTLNSLDRDRGVKLRKLWQEQTAQAQLSGNDPLAVRVSPVLAWLSDGDQEEALEASYRQAVGALERAIDDRQHTAVELEELGLKITQTGRTLPDLLATRFSHATHNAHVRETRRRQVTVAMIVAAVLLLGLGLTAISIAQSRSYALKRLIVGVDGHLAADQIDEAAELLNKHSEFSTSSLWLEANQRVTAAQTAEASRVADFAAAVSTAKSQPTLEASIEQLTKAQNLARRPDEKELVAKLQTEWNASRREHVAKQDDLLRKQIDQVVRRLAAVNDVAVFDDKRLIEMEEALTAAADALAQGQALKSNASPEMQAMFNQVRQRYSSAKSLQESMRDRNVLLKRMTSNSRIVGREPHFASQLSEYERALTEYVQKFPKDSLSQTSIKPSEVKLWNSIFQARQIFEAQSIWLPDDLKLLDLRIDEIEKRSGGLIENAESQNLVTYGSFLKSLRRRKIGDGTAGTVGVTARLRRLFEGTLMQDAQVVLVDGKLYYLTKNDVAALEDKGLLLYISGYRDDDRAKRQLSTKTKHKAKPAPQSLLAKQVVGDIEKLQAEGWLGFTEKIVNQLVTSQASESGYEMDPCLRYLLLLRTVEMAGEGHAFLQEEIARYREQLTDPDFDVAAKWMDPNDTEAHKARLRAEKKLRAATWLSRAWGAARDREQALKNSFQGSVEAVGWLALDSQGNWIVRTSWKPTETIALEVMSEGEVADDRQWKTIGTAGPTEIRIVPQTEANMLQQGRLVFARRRQDNK